MYIDHGTHGHLCVCLSVCLSVCMSRAAFLHYCIHPYVPFGNGRECPEVVNCWPHLQLSKGFVAMVTYAHNVQCQRVICTRSMAGYQSSPKFANMPQICNSQWSGSHRLDHFIPLFSKFSTQNAWVFQYAPNFLENKHILCSTKAPPMGVNFK